MYRVVKRRHREGKIKEVSPHDFRKTFVGDLLDAIGDLSTVQKLAGYSDPATTTRYERRGGEHAIREAASHLHVPHYFGNQRSETESTVPFGRFAEALSSKKPRISNVAYYAKIRGFRLSALRRTSPQRRSRKFGTAPVHYQSGRRVRLSRVPSPPPA